MSSSGEEDSLEREIRTERLRSAATEAREIGDEARETAEARRAKVRGNVLRRVDDRARQARLVDDLETAEDQEELASAEQVTAEALRRNAGEMKETSEEIRRTREQLEQRARMVEEIAETTRRMAARTASLRKGVRNRRNSTGAADVADAPLDSRETDPRRD